MSLDRLCIIAAAMAEVGYRKEAMEMAKTCRAMWTYMPLWGIIKDVPGPRGKTRLMYCAKHRLKYCPQQGRSRRLEWLIRRGANLNAQDSTGHTALHLAILNWQDEATATLIAAGADLNLATAKGETPLMLACFRDAGLVRTLCASGANVGATNSEGKTALDYALAIGQMNRALILQKYGAKIPRLRTPSYY